MNRPILPDESVALGQQAAEIAANALDELGRAMIRQKALDVARQIEIYLDCRSFSALEDLAADAELAAIAVTRIGQSGYTVAHDTRGINLFHYDPKVIGKDLHETASRYPQFWRILERGLVEDADGYYDWPAPDGHVLRKYMYCAPVFPEQIAPLGLVVAATISIDEFLQPSREIRERIVTLAERVDEFTRIEQRRNSRLRATNEFSRKISSYLSVEDLLPYVAGTLRQTFDIQSVRVFLRVEPSRRLMLVAQAGDLPCPDSPEPGSLVEDAVVEGVADTGKPYLSSEDTPARRGAPPPPPGEPCTPVRMAVPIKIGMNVLGVLDVIDVNTRPFGDFDLFTVWPLADQVAIALENARLHNELREMAVLEERNRIAREIHDTLAQGFAGISMLVESAKQALEADDRAQTGELLDRIRSQAREKLSEARRSVQSLRPNIVLQGSLEKLIQGELAHIARDMAIETRFDVVGEERPLSPVIKLALLRICQEALNNIKKHAHASQVDIGLTYNPNAVALFVKDDGIGFNAQTPISNHFGLTFMNERARLVGGSLIVDSQVEGGTKIYVNIPL